MEVARDADLIVCEKDRAGFLEAIRVASANKERCACRSSGLILLTILANALDALQLEQQPAAERQSSSEL